MNEFDVCIIGAGPAGSATAYLLARQGLSVALLDRATFPRDKTCGDGITPRGGRVLQRLGVYDAVRAQAFCATGVAIRGDDVNRFAIPFDVSPGQPSDLMVLPRYALDDILRRHALSAGPAYFDATKIVLVQEVVRDGHDRCELKADDGRQFFCKLAVLATGAESQLLRASGLLDGKPPLEHAARAYFDNVAGLDGNVVLFFDGVDLPGYGWIFPTSATSANIGCGVFDAQGPQQAERMKQLVAQHPLLAPMLKNATQNGPIKAYPLRTDFEATHSGRGRMLCVGEAVGLVNPVTGEGIDYALESAEFLAAAIAQHGLDAPVAVLDVYRASLARRFDRRFKLYRWIRRHCLSGHSAQSFIARVRTAPALRKVVVDGLFGRVKPVHFLRPAVLWQLVALAWFGWRRRKG